MTKTTPKQEAFCMAYLETGCATTAYRQSYNTGRMKQETIYSEAVDMLRHDKIRKRLKELTARHARRHETTVDDIITELNQARDMAMEDRQPTVMRQCAMDKAKLLGLIVDKAESRVSVDMGYEQACEILKGAGIDPSMNG